MKVFVRRIARLFSNRLFLALLALTILAAGITGTLVIRGILHNMKLAAQPDNTPPWSPAYPALHPTADPARAQIIARGEYLAKAGDCIACHTDTKSHGPAYGGGLAMQTPFGIIDTPNISPDPETGLGRWTEADFFRAMKKGISPAGQYYFPAFPFPYFARMPDNDIHALWAYLGSIPPVQQVNRANAMVWPFSIRLLQLPWRILFFHPAGLLPDGASSPLARGEYLVEGPGHCGMCHTPSWHILTDDLPLGAPIKKYHLTGAKVQGYMAMNISASNLGSIPVEEIVRVFTHDELVGGGSVVGPMLEVNHNSLRYLSDKDLANIALYLKSVQSELPPKPAGSTAGEGIYEASCAGCHATGGGGAPKFGDTAAWAALLPQGRDALYANALHGINGMPPKGACLSCTDAEIGQAVDYMLAPVLGASATTIAAPPPPKKLTLAEGERLYTENCSVCHATGFRHAPRPGDVAAFLPAVRQGFLRTLENVITGATGHPVRGACPDCTDADIKAAVQYMMQQSAPGRDYSLW